MFIRVIVVVLSALVLLAGCQRAPEKTAMHPLDQFKEKNDDPIAAAADRYQRRLSADGTVPDRALMIAKAQRDALIQQQTEMFSGNNLPITWEWVGPGNIGGRLRPIVIDPNNTDIMFVGSASGGIWKTINGGQSWFALDDFLPSLSVGDMVMHPGDSDTLFAGTGEGFFESTEGSSNTAAVRGAGIFLTTDAGTTWTQIPSTDNSNFYFVNRIAFDPLNSNILLVAANSGIWRSTDSGLSWTQHATFHALDIKFDPNNSMQLVAGGHDTNDGPYFSSDAGLTWQLAVGAGGERQEMSWAPSQPNTVYAAVSEAGRIKVWRSTDGGRNYTVRTGGNGIQTWASYNNTIWVNPADENHLILGSVRLFRSTDGGINLSQRFQSVHPDMHRIVQHPSFDGINNKTVFFATDGGIWRTNDIFGSSAIDLNNNLGVTQFYGGGINPTTGNIIGGTQDNGTLFYNGDPQNWDHIFGGDGGYGAADPDDPNFYYGEVQRAFIHRSSNGGVSSSYIYGGSNPIGDAGTSRVNFIPFFMLDPNDPNRMLVAGEQMWRSENVKAAQPDWFPIKDSIGPPGRPFQSGPSPSHFNPNSPFNLSTIAVAKGNSDVVWAAHNNGDLYFSSNGTHTTPDWTRVDENGAGLPDRWISTVVIDHNDHSHIYVALMGWEDDNLWESHDSGQTWTDISGMGPMSIPNAPISALALHQNLPGSLYVGTDIGVFTSNDNGLIWTTRSDGPGTVPVEQLLWKNDNTLLAVTHGRGMFLAVENSVLPQVMELLFGFQVDGELSDVFASDNRYLELGPALRANLMKQKIEMVFRATSSTNSPHIFQFRFQSKMIGGQQGNVEQSIKLWDYVADQFELLDTRPVATEDETALIVPTGDLSRFVDPDSREMKANITWKRDSFVRRPFTWTVDVDEAVWLVTRQAN